MKDILLKIFNLIISWLQNKQVEKAEEKAEVIAEAKKEKIEKADNKLAEELIAESDEITTDNLRNRLKL